jgi:uncharacterized protein
MIMKIAVIGTGISGLGAAYLLQQRHEITVYEKNHYLGGHSRTILITDQQGTTSPVDTGFIVFNHRNYPELTGLFRHLGVNTQKSRMSFGVSIGDGYLEYSSRGFLAQKRNLMRPSFWSMTRDILRFNREATRRLDSDPDLTLRQLLIDMKLCDWFCRYYLQAMGAAIWSCSVTTILDFPAATFLRFFNNHGLLTVRQQPQWHTVSGGSQQYVEKLSAGFRQKTLTNTEVMAINRNGNGVNVTDDHGETRTYDQVVIAAPADETLKFLQTPTKDEQDILSCFGYQDNRVIVHSDLSFMPRRKSCWASWVYLNDDLDDRKSSVSLSYWMNNLQNLPTNQPILVTLNPGRSPREDLIYDRHSFRHPVFNLRAIRAQDRIPDIQGKDRIWFCGAYQKYGFHEDGLSSAVHVAEAMGAQIPWR